jgi:hypothetical protein
MAATREGMIPYIHDAFTQLHLGQLLAFVKCTIGDRRDGGINPDMFYISRDSSSSFSCVDEDLSGGGAGIDHHERYQRRKTPFPPGRHPSFAAVDGPYRILQ